MRKETCIYRKLEVKGTPTYLSGCGEVVQDNMGFNIRKSKFCTRCGKPIKFSSEPMEVKNVK